jgi:uncharacterized integral membrane protein
MSPFLLTMMRSLLFVFAFFVSFTLYLATSMSDEWPRGLHIGLALIAGALMLLWASYRFERYIKLK